MTAAHATPPTSNFTDRLPRLAPARLLGLLMLLMMAPEIVSNFLLQPQAWGGAGLLQQTAAARPALLGAVLLDFLGVAIGLGASLLLRAELGSAWPTLTRLGLALAVFDLTRALVEGSCLLAMASLSAHQLAHPALDHEAAAALLKGLRDAVHLLGKGMGGLSLLVFVSTLILAKWLPRWLGLALALGAVAQIWGISQGLVQQQVPLLALAPLGLLYPLSALWLLVCSSKLER